MNLCDYDTIRALLSRHGFHFSKSMGQNFLIDPEVPARIAEASQADRSCGVLEIGPGIGPLTAELAQRAGKVVSVELDKTLLPVLAETMAPYPNVEIVPGDVMKLDLDALIAEKFQGLTPIVCANLPYNITTPVLTRIIETPCLKTVTVLIQKEVAQRLAAPQGSADGGSFSLFLQYYMESELLFDVPREKFHPAPKVRAAGSSGGGGSRRGVFLPRHAGRLFTPAQDPGQQPVRRPAQLFQRTDPGCHVPLRPAR